MEKRFRHLNCSVALLMAALLAMLVFAPAESISAGQEQAEVVLLLLTNDATTQDGVYHAEGTRLVSAHIIALNDRSSTPLGILSVPVHTRVVFEDGNGAAFDTLSNAFAGGGALGVEQTLKSVKYLIGGAEISGAVIITPAAVSSAVDASGGVIIPLSNVPSSAGVAGKNVRLYPLRTDNDSMAILVKTAMNVSDATPDYDMDAGHALRSMSPERISKGDAETVRMTGDVAAELVVRESSSAAYLYMGTQRSVMYAILRAIAFGDDFDGEELEGYESYGVNAAFWQRAARAALTSYERGTSLKGEETTVDRERHFLPDSISLNEWILSNIFGVSR